MTFTLKLTLTAIIAVLILADVIVDAAANPQRYESRDVLIILIFTLIWRSICLAAVSQIWAYYP